LAARYQTSGDYQSGYADPLIVHNFEAESLALSQAGHFCAFDGRYIDQHINATVFGLDKTIALRDTAFSGRL
jgi:hypothetical protein